VRAVVESNIILFISFGLSYDSMLVSSENLIWFQY